MKNEERTRATVETRLNDFYSLTASVIMCITTLMFRSSILHHQFPVKQCDVFRFVYLSAPLGVSLSM